MTSPWWLALLIASAAIAILVTTWADDLDRDLYTQDQSRDDEEEINWP